MSREIKENPGKFAGGELGGVFLGVFILPIISALILLIGLFILGFTSLWGGPFSFFKVLFFFAFFGVFTFFYILRKAHVLIKITTEGRVNDTLKVESKVVE